MGLPMASSFHKYAIDSFNLENGVLFASGWFISLNPQHCSLQIRVTGSDGAHRLLPVQYGLPRHDVAKSHPTENSAVNSGFWALGSVAGIKEIASLAIVVDDNGKRFEIEAYKKERKSLAARFSERLLSPSWIYILKRSVSLLRQGQLRQLWQKGSKHLSSVPRGSLQLALTSLAEISAAHPLKALVIDHNLGGGANKFRQQLEMKLAGDGIFVCLLSFNILSLSYTLQFSIKGKNSTFNIGRAENIEEILDAIAPQSIYLNNLVSFPGAKDVLAIVTQYTKSKSAELFAYIHDYHSVCPSHFLLDHKGVYCGVPDLSRCAECLPNNSQPLVAIYNESDIESWRSAWDEAFEAAKEVIFFSQASLDIVKKAHPDLPTAKTHLRPHVVKLAGNAPRLESGKGKIVIGVVGQLGYHKGSEVVMSLFERIATREPDIELVVIGTLEGVSSVRQTGAYDAANFAATIEKSGANVFLFPSIWPETFSYVVQELIEMNLPVACFDLGAPAERVRKYNRGLVIPDMKDETILESMSALFQRAYGTME